MPGPRILGQSDAAVTDATLYTSPASPGAGTVLSTIALISTGAAGTAQVRLVPAGATAAAKHNVITAATVAPRELITVTAGFTLAPGDRITVTTTGGAGVHAYGTEL